MKYLFVIEKAPRNYGGYFPDVPGCVATARTVEKLLVIAAEALEAHFEDGEAPPKARSLKAVMNSNEIEDDYALLAWVDFNPTQQLAPV